MLDPVSCFTLLVLETRPQHYRVHLWQNDSLGIIQKSRNLYIQLTGYTLGQDIDRNKIKRERNHEISLDLYKWIFKA